MDACTHKVKYYETDKMGITHHSNYIRWMEEARVDFLDKLGYGFKKLEDSGIVSPVLSVNCDYKHSTTFDDEIEISVSVKSFTGVKLTIGYEMRKKGSEEIVCTASSVHCFLNAQGRPIRFNKEHTGFYNALMSQIS